MRISIFSIFYLICFTIKAQILQSEEPSNDFLKQQLQNLSEKINSLQADLKNAKSQAEKNSLLADIDKRQVEAVKLSGSFVERFAQGAKATETILSALETGSSIGELSSPFVSPTFTKKYDNWMSKWGKFIPAVIVPSLALSVKGLNTDQKFASIPIGISLTGLISAITRGDEKKTTAIESSLKEFQSTMDLFDLNRLVYSDIQKLKSFIASAHKADSTLSKELIEYWSKNKDLFLKSDVDLQKDERFKEYINKSQVYISRFQVRLTKVKFVLDHVESMLNSYTNRQVLKDSQLPSATRIQQETKDALQRLISTYNNFHFHWEELQGKFYQISPEELRKLDSYYVLENLRLQVQVGK